MLYIFGIIALQHVQSVNDRSMEGNLLNIYNFHKLNLQVLSSFFILA